MCHGQGIIVYLSVQVSRYRGHLLIILGVLRLLALFAKHIFTRRLGIWWYVATIGLGGPFAIFCIVRCGMPGLVCRHPSGHGLCRRSNPEYDFFHVLWHLSSGLGEISNCISGSMLERHSLACDICNIWFRKQAVAGGACGRYR